MVQKKVILAFAGGLQSSVCLHWLYKKRGAEVTAIIVKLGSDSQTFALGEQAVELGASGAYVEDCREKFIREYAFRVLRASAVYEHNYMLSGALTRPLIAEVLAKRACRDGIESVALGTYSNSDDARRFRSNVAILAPNLNIVGPDQIPPLQNREKALEYAQKNNIAFSGRSQSSLNCDINLWGSVVSLNPEMGTWEPLSEKYYCLTVRPEDAVDEAETMTIDFENGEPTSINGEHMVPHQLVDYLNTRAGEHGIGRVEAVEDRMSGHKAREVYEAPGAYVLSAAHTALEELCLDYETLQAKEDIGRSYANIVYKGDWFSRLRSAYDDFFSSLQSRITGTVSVKLYKGNIKIAGRCSPNTLFDDPKKQ